MYSTTLVNSGVDRKLAESNVKNMLKRTETKILELHGRGGINCDANGARRNLNVKGLRASYSRTEKPAGTGGDSGHDDRRQAREMVNSLKPDFIVGNPPCTQFRN